MSAQQLQKELKMLEDAKVEMLKQTFGSEEKAKQVAAIKDKLAKSVFDARKQQLQSQRETYAERAEALKGVENFWPLTLQKSSIADDLEEGDIEAISHLTDLRVEYSSEDPRDYAVVFTFSDKNPYFSETELRKEFKVHDEVKKATPYDLDGYTVNTKTAISWKDDKHNLCKKNPRPDISKLEEYDEVNSMGSFFNFFTTDEAEVNSSLGERLQQVYEDAIDIFAGIEDLDNEGDSDDDLDEESDDNAEEVDLGDSETDMPKKKKAKKE